MAKMTEKNTKAEILQAYEEMTKRLKETQSQKVEPQKEIAIKAETAVKERAVKASMMDTAALTSVVLEAVHKLEEITSAYSDVEASIELKKKELKEIYGIEQEANSLFALINAKKELSDRADEENSQKVNYWNGQIEALKSVYYDTKNELEKARKRDEEQYKYELNLRKRQDNDKLTEELNSKKAQFKAEMNEDIEKLHKMEADIVARENAIEAAKEKLEKVDTLEALVVKLKDDVRDKAIEVNRLKKEFEYEKSLLENQKNGAISILESKIASLQETLEDAKYNNKTLSDKLDDAYANMKEIANEASRSSSNASTISALKDAFKNTGTKA